MQDFLFGIGVLALIVAWKYVWLPTILDYTRDKLFDLRDGFLREAFLQEKFPLDHPIYKSLRNLLNGHLKHTESLSIWEFLAFYYSAKNLRKDLLVGVNEIFKTDDRRLNEIISRVRFQSAKIMAEYMLLTSMIAIPMLFVALVFFTLRRRSIFKKILATKPVVRARALIESAALVP